MTSPPPTVRGTGELIATLPYQLGHEPRRSLVMVMLRRTTGRPGRTSGSVLCTTRSDLPPPGQEAETVAYLAAALRTARPDLVELLAFESEQDDATAVLRAVSACCGELAIPVDSEVRVRNGRWIRLQEPDGTVPVWRVVPDASNVPAAADLVLQGVAPGRGREELIEELGSGRPLTQQAVRVRLAQRLDEPTDLPDIVRAGARAMAPVVVPGTAEGVRRLSVDEVCDIVEALEDKGFRDAVISWMCPGHLGPGLQRAEVMEVVAGQLPIARIGRDRDLLDRLVELALRVPFELSAPVLTVLAQTAWWQGNGMVGNVAVDRALQISPDYYLAQLVSQLLTHLVRPPHPTFAAVA